mgnify:CR=1 FL=1
MTNKQFGDPRNASHRVSVKIICRAEQKILVIRAKGKETFNLVWWWVDLGEWLNEALQREFLEETGYTIDSIAPQLVDVEIKQFQPWGQFDAVVNVFYLIDFEETFVPQMEEGVYEERVWADKESLELLSLSEHSNKSLLLSLI